MPKDDDLKINEKILLLQHCFYYDSLGEEDSLKFLNDRLTEKGFKKVNSFQEAAYLFTDRELETILNGITVVYPFKGKYYTFKNKHLYIQQDSSDKVLTELDRVLRIYKEKAYAILKILTLKDKVDSEELTNVISNILGSNIDFAQILGDLQNNYQLLQSSIENNKIFWRIPAEIKDLIIKQLKYLAEYEEINQKIESLLKTTLEESISEPTFDVIETDKTFVDLSEVLELIREDKSSIEQELQGNRIETKIETQNLKEISEEVKEEKEQKSITVEGYIKKILKNDITFRTIDGQEVRFTCNKPELIAYCIGHINKLLRFYFDVKAAELVCQKVELAE